MPFPSLLIIGDLLTDPLVARARALALDYDPVLKDSNYPGVISTKPLPVTGLDETISRIIGVRVRP